MKNFKRVLSLALAALMVIGGLVVAPVDAKAETIYTPVTSASEVTTGDYVVVVKSGTKYFAMSTESAGKYFKNVEITVDGNNISSTSTIPVWKITNTDGVYSFHNGTGYMNYAGEKNVTVATTESTKTQWSISASSEETGAFLISPVADSTPTYLAYNASNPRFTNYKVSSNQNDNIYLYAVGTGEGGGTTPTPDPEPTPNPEPTYANDGEIVDAVYALADGSTLDDGEKYDLTGKVIAVNTGYASNKITVTIVVPGKEDKPIQCYNLKAGTVTDVSTVDVGDTITANGALKNYKGTYEFNGCTLEARTASTDNTTYANAEELLAAVSALEVGYGIAGKHTLTGVVKSIDTAYDSQYKNITVTITVDDTDVKCFRLKGTGADAIAAGDSLTVTGNIMKYNATTIEFVAGCTLDERIAAGSGDDDNENGSESGSESEDPSNSESESEKESEKEELTAKDILAEAAKLEDGQYLGGSKDVKYTLKGVITKYEFNEQYGDASITIKVDGTDETFYCYQVKGEDVKNLKVGDRIELNGAIKNYKGTIEFERPNLVAILPTGDFSSVGTVMILIAGVACLAVAFTSKKKMA